MTIIGNGKRFTEVKHASEKDFEEDILVTSQILFGKATIFINAKKKIEWLTLGGTIPEAASLTFLMLQILNFI